MSGRAQWPAAKGDVEDPFEGWIRRRGETWFRPRPGSPSLDFPEHALIAASRVTGASVYDRRGRRVGRIVDLAVDAASGAVVRARVVGGGLLGIGRRTYQPDWADLAYDVDRERYVLSSDAAEIEQAGGSAPAAWGPAADQGGWG
jgi:sporulation protein YlmC with PRC-barrel domain